ncbi:cytochrome-c peroxidase [Flavobacterium sp. Sd200]|uniref:cytochrome-c peroxidase n=1 Tax=Flavobacterium sp. Sd200 TaxID=2692211 RepID=UPI0013687A25|nr:cytochrome c peroxidase [Flavobacterium sp. Sd200]MXN91515.1 cytochrome-c peroxidase [Flavobacterium sp. Sd200]
MKYFCAIRPYINFAFPLVALCSALILWSFSPTPDYTTPEIIKLYTTELNEKIIAFDKAATDFEHGKITQQQLQQLLSETRISYKRVEFFLAFHYPEYCKEHLNGAPLLQIEKEGTLPKVIQPEGFQVLDELVFSNEAKEEKYEITALSKKLVSNYGLLLNGLAENKQANSYGITAMRLQLVRITSLGITGFDTPGSLNALPEAIASLEAMKVFFEQNFKQGGLNNDIIVAFNGAVAQLKNTRSFDSLDRFDLIKNHIDVLYNKLGRLDSTQPDFLKHTSGWNTQSSSIFGANFLDPYYFSVLKQDEDSPELRALGKTLFYDPALSNDSKFSCASCHNPQKAFTDGVAKSASNVQGKTVLRNAPTLLNAVYADRYFYDLRAFTLEQQAEHVIFNRNEFNTAYSAIIKKLQGTDAYATQFKKVFGKNSINRENLSKALASYVLSLQSFNSDFDKYIRGEQNNIPQHIKRGFNLFMGKANCATCHFAPTFAGLVPPLYNENESEILGVLEDPNAKSPKLDTDSGRFDNRVDTEKAWIYEKSFKTTTVRNAGLTAPYFHNGAYKTLEEVVDFYNNGGGGGLGLNVVNQTLAADPLNLTQSEKNDLIAFIKSLNDTSAAKY